MNKLRSHLVVLLMLAVIVNGLPYEDSNANDNDEIENQDLTQSHRRRHEGRRERANRNKRHYASRSRYPFYDSEDYYENKYYMQPRIDMPYYQPVDTCPERAILKEVLKAMQTPQTFKVYCEPKTPGIDDRLNLATIDKSRIWALTHDVTKSTPLDDEIYGKRPIDLNPYEPPEAVPSKVAKEAREGIKLKTDKKCEFVFLACCNDETTVQSCYENLGCKKTYEEGRSCKPKTPREIYQYFHDTYMILSD